MKIEAASVWLVCAASLFLFGCDGADADASNHEPSREAPTTGVADDGSLIVFAGTREGAARVAATTSAARDADRLIREPNVPDPEGGEFTLEEAVVGLPIDGSLVAEIGTDFGTLFCDLYADRTPNTVANFVGLARGLRPWWDARAGEWVRRPYYRDLTFHRVIPGYLVQGGDYLGDGTGTVGYSIPDEPSDTLAHDRAGQLAMANHAGPDTAGAQFFFTDGPAPQLDTQGYTIFGQCRPQHVISQLARVPQQADSGNRPLTEIHITRVIIRRVVGGAQAAVPTVPPPAAGNELPPRGASPDPSTLHRRHDPRQYGEPSPFPNGMTGPPSPPRPTPRQP